MTLVIAGLLIWSGMHLMPFWGAGLRKSLQGAIGANPYRGLFSLAIVGSIVLIVFGWRTTDAEFVYDPPSWGRHATMLLVFLAIMSFGAGSGKSNLRRFIRHPQLTGMILFCTGHLLANGDSLSVLTFGGLGVWAIVEILLLNRREGEWVKPEPTPLSAEIKLPIISVVLYAILLFAHQYVIGVNPMG